MHWRASTWALIAWTALMLAWMLVSVSATAGGGGHVELAILAVLVAWALVAVPLAAFWYTRRKTGTGETAQFDPRDHWPPPPR